MIPLFVALAGGAGAGLRLITDDAVSRRTGRPPYARVTVNVLGSLLLGVLTGLVIYHGVSDRLTTIAGVGFCGGFTTFSAASLDVAGAALDRRPRGAAVIATANALGSIAAAVIGLVLAKLG